jgi:hypothetical protein
MESRRRPLAVALSVVALAAAPAAAEVWHVTLHNGNTIDSRYQPQEASWDAGKVMMLTDMGNWIALAKADIASIGADTQHKGFGFVINTTTIALGWAPNDALTPEEQASADAAAGGAPAEAPASPYSVEQFVEPDQAQGIPAGWLGYGSVPPVGAAGTSAPAPVAAPVGGAEILEPPSPPSK